MIEGCGGQCLKIFLVAFNIIFFIFGLALAGVAGYSAFDKASMIHRMLAQYNQPVLIDGLYILMAVGLLLAIVAFFGLWGSLAENRCILFMYFILVLVIFALQLAGIIISLVEYKKIEAQLIMDLSRPPPSNTTAHNFGSMLSTSVLQAAMQAIEQKFHCCGITGPKNYEPNPVPVSCYAPYHTTTQATTTAASRSRTNAEVTEAPPPPVAPSTTMATTTPKHGMLYTTGCAATVRPYLYAAGGIAIGILVLEVVVMLFTCCLVSAIKDDYVPV